MLQKIWFVINKPNYSVLDLIILGSVYNWFPDNPSLLQTSILLIVLFGCGCLSGYLQYQYFDVKTKP